MLCYKIPVMTCEGKKNYYVVVGIFKPGQTGKECRVRKVEGHCETIKKVLILEGNNKQ